MRKAVLFIIFLLLHVTIMQSTPVNSRQAALKAKAFLASRNLGENQTLTMAMQGRQKTIGKGGAASQPYYYVFNRGEDRGFVIVSGDDGAEEILGYADHGSFDPASLPDNMRAWLDNYAEEIEWIQQHPAEGKRRVATQQDPGVGISKMVVAPLIETIWGQDNPYNMRCPTVNEAKTVTGCVATALAQVMYYYKWPQEETGSIPKYTIGSQVVEGLEPTTFDWGKMMLAYDKNDFTDSPASLAVADLMYYCGHAVKMSYGVTSSAADAMESARALNEYFGYANPTMTANRDAYSTEEWENLVYSELAAGRPVYYAASASNGNGHAFVCDGYDGDGLFHINWGWNGVSDGFFRLQALNPAIQGTGGSGVISGFSLRQMIVFHISPQVLETEVTGLRPPIVQVVNLELSNSQSEIDYNGEAFSNVKVENSFRVPVAGHYSLGVALCKGDEMLQVHYMAEGDLPATYDMRFTNPVSLSGLGSGLEDGVYQIRCVCKFNDESEWKFDTDSERIYLEVTIADGKASFEEKVLNTTLDVISVEQRYDNSTAKQIRATIENDGPYDFCGTINLYVDGSKVSAENLQLAVNQRDFIDFVFKTDNNPVALKIVVKDTGEVIYEDESFTFEPEPEMTPPEVLAYEVRNLDEEKMKMYGNIVEAAVTLKNNTEEAWSGNVNLYVHFSSSDTSKSTMERLTLQAGETREVVVRYPNLSYGSKVWFDLSVGNWIKTVGSSSAPYLVTAGYEEWDANGVRQARELATNTTISPSAVAVRIRGCNLSDVNITPNTNPNTIYFLDDNAVIPSSLEEKNVVKGYKAVGDIVWQQGYGYYVPTSFDVEGKVRYMRTPKTSCDEYQGWETISLPFSVKTIMVEDEEIHWTGNEEDGLWVRSLEGVDGNHLFFTTVKDWKANEPYIIGVPEEMKNKPMTLAASNVKILKTASSVKVVDGYRFVATTADQALASAYVFNETGDAFQLTENTSVKAGEAYITTNVVGEDVPQLLYINWRLPGDVNRDGLVNMTDVLLMVMFITGEEPNVFDEFNADFNQDGDISVTDVMLVIDTLL